MIGFYMERLGKWEYSIQASSGGLFEVNAKIQSLSKKRSELEQQMFEEDHEFHQAKTELNQQKAQEKAWEKLIEERWNQLEFAI